MATTKARYRELIIRGIGGYQSGTIDLAPLISDTEAQRVVQSAKLSNIERPPTGYSHAYIWARRYNEGRQIEISSFRSLDIAVYTPPASGSDTLTFWGYGATDPITLTGTADEKAEQIQDEITAIAGIESATVTAMNSGAQFRIDLPTASEITVESSSGTMLSGIGACSVTRPWRNALPYGVIWEYSPRLPFDDDGDNLGLNSIVNQSLDRVMTTALKPYTIPGATAGEMVKAITLVEPWLKLQDQVHTVWAPTRRQLAFTLTPPGSATFDLSLTLGLDDPVVVEDVAFDASADEIESAIMDALEAVSMERSVAVTADGSDFSVSLGEVYYSRATAEVSAGTISDLAVNQLEPRRRLDGCRLFLDGPTKTLEIPTLVPAGRTIEVEMTCPASSWIIPQVDYLTEGTAWESSTDGLTYDLDQADADEKVVAEIGIWLAYMALEKRDPDRAKYWARLRSEQAESAASLKADSTPKPNQHQGRVQWDSGPITKFDLMN